MHGNDGFRFQQVAGISGLTRTHGVVITDGQHSNSRRIEVANDCHVAKDVGVAGMIYLDAVFKFDHVAARFSAVNQCVTVLNSARMIGVDHGDFDVLDLLRSTFVHFRCFFHPFFAQPTA